MNDSSRGFTLIEMVVAFAILGLTLTALYAVFENVLARTAHDARFSEASLIAESLLDRVGTEWPVGSGSQSGAWNEFSYEIRNDAAVLARTLPTQQVTVSVSWTEASNRQTITISTLKLAPRVFR